MNSTLLKSVLCLALAGSALATDPTYLNSGTITVAPNIDAVTFINNGTFGPLSTLDPFKTQSTLNYSNNYEMSAYPGFDFALFQGGSRKPAANFFNKAPQPNGRGGIIQALDTIVVASPGVIIPFNYNSRLMVFATNINNQGYLVAGGGGLIRLVGTNVSLQFSTVAINPVVGIGALPVDTTTFIADVGIYDRYWGLSNASPANQTMISTGISPSHYVTNYPGNVFGNVITSIGTGFVWANTNLIASGGVTITNMDGTTSSVIIESNLVVEVAFVGPDTPVFTSTVSVTPSTIRNNFFNSFNVGLLTTATNPVARTDDILTLGVVDGLAATRPNPVLAQNAATNPPSYKPGALTVSRTITTGGIPNAAFDQSLFTGGTTDWGFTMYTNARVDLNWAGYCAHVDNMVGEPVPPTTSATNLPGRVEITAGSLNIEKARIRAEGSLNIKAKHVISMTNAVLDCQNLVLDLGSTNGLLRFIDIFPVTVERVQGDVFVWSGVWTNTRVNVITNNYIPDPAGTTNASGGTNYVQALLTNQTEVAFHVLIVNAPLQDTVPAVTESLALRATNVVNDAHVTINNSFVTDAQSFTHNGSLTIGQAILPISFIGPGAMRNLSGTNLPNLLYFTNNGTLSVANDAHFGDDRSTPFAAIVNSGSLSAGSLSFKSAYFETTGTIGTSGFLFINAESAKLENGSSTSAGDLLIQGGDVKLRKHTLNAGTLYLSVSNALFDNGAGSGNSVVVGGGFQLLNKPTTGDLLGTQFSSAANFGIISHVWAGEDRGASRAGFSNNVAIGYLRLTNVFGLLTFYGAGAHNGLYVDYLDLGASLTNLQDLLSVDPSLTIYFAAASLPAEQLDGQLGGRLRWVRDYAGANSSASVLLPNGQTITVNKAFRQSMNIDSDADGLPNGADPSPFDGVIFSRVTVTNQPPPRSVQIAWEAAAGTAYRVEFATNLVAPVWQFLANYTNSAATNGPATVVDAGVPTSQSQRYYRVVYTP